MLRELFLGFIRIHILYHAGRERIYGADMIEELARHGYSVSPGTMYPILHAMEKEGYLKCAKANVAGRIRKYYEITDEGMRMLAEAKGKIKELVEEVLDE